MGLTHTDRLPDDRRPDLDVVQVLVPDVVAHGPRPVRERLDRPFARTP
ncbi:hypothetical protein HC251_00275 [Iamia sp. SCSIO 61187]|nr:hypothetical protein [Iamia sp. SCSIO 61187]QYG91018.1 hypothetical protein HC251_00275 [Iamia sp. SCSIO 61187]